jgi:hypothetical protein
MTRVVMLVAAATFLAVAGSVRAGGITNQLLLSSAWCTFSYNKVTGYSTSKRVHFSENGIYRVDSRGEGASSGRYGSIAGQNDSGSGGRWRVDRGELFLSDGGELEHVETFLKRNSSGYPVIVADGVEYSTCR